MVLPKKTWLKWTRPVKSVLDQASESNRWKSKKKDLIIVLHYTIATIKTKKIQKKQLFSEDIYTFSPVSLIDVSVLPRHFKFSSLYTRGGLQKTSLATPIMWLFWPFLSMPGKFSLYKLFRLLLPFFPFLFPPPTYFDIVAQMPHFYSSLEYLGFQIH